MMYYFSWVIGRLGSSIGPTGLTPSRWVGGGLRWDYWDSWDSLSMVFHSGFSHVMELPGQHSKSKGRCYKASWGLGSRICTTSLHLQSIDQSKCQGQLRIRVERGAAKKLWPYLISHTCHTMSSPLKCYIQISYFLIPVTHSFCICIHLFKTSSLWSLPLPSFFLTFLFCQCK